MVNPLVNQKEDTTLKGKRSHSMDAVDIRITEQLDSRLSRTFAVEIKNLQIQII